MYEAAEEKNMYTSTLKMKYFESGSKTKNKYYEYYKYNVYLM